MERDSIETFINQWKKERPDLDPWPVGVLGRVSLAGSRIIVILDTKSDTGREMALASRADLGQLQPIVGAAQVGRTIRIATNRHL